MTKVGSLSQFPKGCYVQWFYGKTYELAIDEANKSGSFDYYYEQNFGRNNSRQGKSILVSYMKKENEDEIP